MRLFLSREEKDFLNKLKEFGALTSVETVSSLQAETIALKKKVTDLEIQRAQKEEEWQRGDRELRHMIGLEKKRQEFEIDAAKRDTELKVRQENLTADKKRFSEEMEFQRGRFEQEVGYLKDMIGQVLERIPNIGMQINRQEGSPVVEIKHGR